MNPVFVMACLALVIVIAAVVFDIVNKKVILPRLQKEADAAREELDRERSRRP
jgi:hypothetical protein